jgi:hypothetical protein
MSDVIDIDARAGSFEPVRVKFRGQEHVLGSHAIELVGATAIYTTNPKEEDETEIGYAVRIAPLVLRALSPELDALLDAEPLSAAEEFAIVPVLTEVVKRIGALEFRTV